MNDFLKSKYKIFNPRIKQLNGYINLNYKIESNSSSFILKEFPLNKINLDFISAENDILLHLDQNKTGLYPTPIKNIDGDYITIVSEKNKFFWLLTYLNGKFLVETKHTAELFESFGSFLSTTDVKLQDYGSYVIEARQIEWDLQYFQQFIPEKTKFIENPTDRKLVEYFIQQHREKVEPELPKLRK